MKHLKLSINYVSRYEVTKTKYKLYLEARKELNLIIKKRKRLQAGPLDKSTKKLIEAYINSEDQIRSFIIYEKENLRLSAKHIYKFHLDYKKYYIKRNGAWSNSSLSYEADLSDMSSKRNYYKQIKQNLMERLKEVRRAAKNVISHNYSFAFRNIPTGKMHNFRRTGTEARNPLVHTQNHFRGNFCYGWTHMRPNTFYNIMLTRLNNKAFEPKKPTTGDNHIGLELELLCKATKSELEAEIVRAKLEEFIQIKDDGSINNEEGYYPHEICILTKEHEFANIVERTCKLLHEQHAKVNKSCGMHVHLDMRHRDESLAFHNLVTAQPLLYSMNPKSRLNGQYSRKTKNKSFAPTGNRNNRYLGVNPEAYKEHETLEIRIHSGTVSATKIINWVNLLRLIISKPERIKRSPTTFKGFMKAFNVEKELAQYIAQRIKKFELPEEQVMEEVA